MLGSLVFPGNLTKCPLEVEPKRDLPICRNEKKLGGLIDFPITVSNALYQTLTLVFNGKRETISPLQKKSFQVGHSEQGPTVLTALYRGRPLLSVKLQYAQDRLFLGGITTLRVLGGDFAAIRTDMPFVRIHNLTSQDLTFNSGLLVPAKKVITFKGNLHNGLSLGFELSNDQRLFTPLKIKRIITDIYFGTVTESVPYLYTATRQ